MTQDVAITRYPDRGTLMRSLAELVADQLRAAHATRGVATLAVPGGTTPGPFLEALSEEDLVWNEISVLLTDEREVPASSDRSNGKLLRETLVKNAAETARVVNFLDAGTVAGAAGAVEAVLPLDVVVLGMGADMHTASLFPDAPELAEGLAEDAPAIVAMTPAGQPERRLSLSARVLRGAGVAHILITGPEKAKALEAALGARSVTEAPVRAVLTAPCPVTVHYAD